MHVSPAVPPQDPSVETSLLSTVVGVAETAPMETKPTARDTNNFMLSVKNGIRVVVVKDGATQQLSRMPAVSKTSIKVQGSGAVN